MNIEKLLLFFILLSAAFGSRTQHKISKAENLEKKKDLAAQKKEKDEEGITLHILKNKSEILNKNFEEIQKQLEKVQEMNKDVFNQFINHIEFSKFFKYLNIKKEKNPENIKKIKELNTVMNKLKKLQFDTLLEYLGICEAIPSDHMAKEYCMDFISKMAGLHEMLRAKLKNVTMAKDNNEADPKLSDVEKENFDKIIENTKPPKQENANFIHYIYNALRNASIGHVNDFENFWQKEHKD